MKKIQNAILFILLFIALTSITKTVNATTQNNYSYLSNLDTTNTIFYSPTSDEVIEYYSEINEGETKDTVLDKLQSILKKGQLKVEYSSGDTSTTNWNGYYLYERDYILSPLTQAELNGNYKTSGIWLDVMYMNSPIYIDSKINNGTYKYYTDWNEDTHSGTTLATGTFFDTTQFNETNQLDREHVWPKSFGFNGENNLYKELTAGTDAHNLHAAESVGNQDGHNNYPYGNVKDKASSTSIKSGITGEIVGYLGKNVNNIDVFEPRDEDKGDIARTLFYMAARYHNFEVDPNNNSNYTPALTLVDDATKGTTIEPIGTKDFPCGYGELSDLLEWNKLDPVSNHEIMRNDLIYLGIQKNRNPFVDFPSWADVCFKNEKIDYDDIVIRKLYLGETVEETNPILNDYVKHNVNANLSFNFIEKEIEVAKMITDTIPKSKITSTYNNSVFRGNSVSYSTISSQYAHCLNSSTDYIAIDISNVKLDTVVDISYTARSTGTVGSNSTLWFEVFDSNGNSLKKYSEKTDYQNAMTEYTEQILIDNQNASEIRLCTTKKTGSNMWIKELSVNAYRNVLEPYYCDFSNIAMNFKVEFDFSKYNENSHYTETGILLVLNGNISDFTNQNSTTSKLPTLNAKKYIQTDYSKTTFIVQLKNIPINNVDDNVLAVPYILVDGIYYYAVAKEYSVKSILNAYLSLEDELSFDDGTIIKIKDIANAFISDTLNLN